VSNNQELIAVYENEIRLSKLQETANQSYGSPSLQGLLEQS